MILFKKDRKKFWKNLIKNIIILNPARSILIPLSIITTLSIGFSSNSIGFIEVYKHFVDKSGEHYYVLNNETIESEKELELFEDSDGYYIKKIQWGDGKTILFTLSFILTLFAITTLFAEKLEIKKAVYKTILNDIVRHTDSQRYKTVFTAYSKLIYKSNRETDVNELYGLEMSVSDFIKLPDYLIKEDVRDKKLEEIGIN
jgi:hypothetical protein